MILPFTNFPTMYGFSCLKQAGSVPSPPCWAAAAGVAESPWKQLEEMEVFQGLGVKNKVPVRTRGSRGDR